MRYAQFMNGPLKGKTLRIPRNIRVWEAMVPREIAFVLDDQAPVEPTERNTVTYRQLEGSYILHYEFVSFEEWSIEGVWDDEMRSDFFRSVA